MSLFGSALGAIAGGVMNMLGQSYANSLNSAEAEKDREFQREVLQNRHQWETEDWQKAGFNRIMSLNSSGGSGTGTSIAMQNPLAGLGEGISSAVDKVQSEKQLKSLIKQRDIQNNNISADTDLKRDQSWLVARQEDKLKEDIRQLREAMPYIVQDFKNKASNSAKEGLVMDSTIAANKASASQSYSAGAYYDEQKRKLSIENNINENLGTGGRVVRDFIGSIAGDTGRKGFDYFNRVFGGDYSGLNEGWRTTGERINDMNQRFGVNSQYDW